MIQNLIKFDRIFGDVHIHFTLRADFRQQNCKLRLQGSFYINFIPFHFDSGKSFVTNFFYDFLVDYLLGQFGEAVRTRKSDRKNKLALGFFPWCVIVLRTNK